MSVGQPENDHAHQWAEVAQTYDGEGVWVVLQTCIDQKCSKARTLRLETDVIPFTEATSEITGQWG